MGCLVFTGLESFSVIFMAVFFDLNHYRVSGKIACLFYLRLVHSEDLAQSPRNC